MVERGLFRSDDADDQAIANALFKDLHKLRDAGVTKKLTSIIRDNLPEGCPADIVRSYSAKSTRRGAITELCSHRNIRALDACGRSGHATGTSLDSYVDKSYILRALRSGKALSKFTGVDSDIKVPRLESLGPHATEAVRKLVHEMFVVSVKAFLPTGSLHVVLRTCAASWWHRPKAQVKSTGCSSSGSRTSCRAWTSRTSGFRSHCIKIHCRSKGLGRSEE